MNDWIDPILENLKRNKLLWAEDKVPKLLSLKDILLRNIL